MKTETDVFGWRCVADADSGKPCNSHGLLGVVVFDDPRPLVLTVDLQVRNQGASLTNVTARAVEHMRQQFALTGLADLVQLDSMGAFDVVHVADENAGAITWGPVVADEQRPRTLEAFLVAYGQRGRAAWLKAEETLDGLGVRVHTKRRLFDDGDERGAIHVLSERVGDGHCAENASS